MPVSTTVTQSIDTRLSAVADAVQFDLAEIPELLADLDGSVASGIPAPLVIAQRVAGFPIPVGVPAESSLFRLEVSTFVADEVTEWRWLYEAFAADDVGDIDISLPGQGSGAVALAELYDPILSELGFGRNGSTGSDPGESGGPNSLNHVYPPDGAVFIAGVSADVANIKVWASEDLLFPEDTLEPGYRIDLDAGLPNGVEPVPLLAALGASISLPADTVMRGSTLRLWNRSEDSVDAALGQNYLDVSLLWGTSLSLEDVIELYSVDVPVFEPWLAAEPSFFNEGEFELETVGQTFDASFELPVLLLLRYPGRLRFTPAEAGGSLIELELRLESGRQELLPPAD